MQEERKFQKILSEQVMTMNLQPIEAHTMMEELVNIEPASDT